MKPRLADWLESLADRPTAMGGLFIIPFIESAVFPLPVDLLLLPLCLIRPRASFSYASLCIAGSVAGAAVGYLVGATLFDTLGGGVLSAMGMNGRFDDVLRLYHDHAFLTLLFSGFTSIPFTVFTLAAGFHRTLALSTLLLGALAGRIIRFYFVAFLLFRFGPAAKPYVTRIVPAVSLILLIVFVITLLWLRG